MNTQSKFENITLINGDCMDYMQTLPDNAYDLAIVDPPYGVGSVTYMPHKRESTSGGFIDHFEIVVATLDLNQRKKTKVDVCNSHNTKKTMNHFGDENVSPSPDYFRELFRVSKHQIIWGGNYFLLPPSRGYVVWKKRIPENFSMAMCEFAWLSFNTNAKVVEINQMSTKTDVRFHPTQKPIDLYKWLLKNYANVGDKILDTHLGSGSSAIACHDYGFEMTGIEIDKDYFNAAKERLIRHQQQQKLF